MSEKCKWTTDSGQLYGTAETECGWTDDPLMAIQWSFCPSCGKKPEPRGVELLRDGRGDVVILE